MRIARHIRSDALVSREPLLQCLKEVGRRDDGPVGQDRPLYCIPASVVDFTVTESGGTLQNGLPRESLLSKLAQDVFDQSPTCRSVRQRIVNDIVESPEQRAIQQSRIVGRANDEAFRRVQLDELE